MPMAMAVASSLNPKSFLNPNSPPLRRNGATSLRWRSRLRRRGTAPSRIIISRSHPPLGNRSSLFRSHSSKEADEYQGEDDERAQISTSSSAELFKCRSNKSEIIWEEAKTALLELCGDKYNKILVIEEGLLPVPLVGSEAYKSYKTSSHTWPSFLHGAEVQKQSKPSSFGANELLVGLHDHGLDNLGEYKEKAIAAQARQHFLAGIGAMKLEGEESQMQSSRNKQQTLLPLEDGIARLVLILELGDISAITRAARAVADASISEHVRISFKEGGAIKPLVHQLHHSEEAARDSAAHALEMLCISSGVCNVIESENLFHSLFGLVTNAKTPENIKEKIVNILARMFNPEKLWKAELSDEVRTSENPPKSVEGSHLCELDKATDPISSPKTESGREALLHLGIVFHLVDLLKTCSLNMQRKVTHILEYLANFDVHLSEIIRSDLDAALLTVLDRGCFNGENDNEQELHALEVEEAGLVVESACRLLTKLLDFDQFYTKKDLIPLLNLLRKILKSNIPLRAKDWIAACLVKMQLLAGPGVGVEHPINMEVTLYKTIPRLVEQMRSPSLEYREAAIINLKDVVSEGMMECSREIATLGGIFPLVEIIGHVDGASLDAGLALLYNLSMDIENHHAIISAGAVPVLRRIVLSQKPQWPLALNLLRTLPT